MHYDMAVVATVHVVTVEMVRIAAWGARRPVVVCSAVLLDMLLLHQIFLPRREYWTFYSVEGRLLGTTSFFA